MPGAMMATWGSAGGGGGGGGGDTVQLIASTYYDDAPAPSDTYADVSVSSGKTVVGFPYLGAGSNNYPWLSGSGAASDYEVRMTVTSGTPSGPAAGSWHNLGTTRTWSVSNPAGLPRIVSAVFTLEIRRVSDSVVVAGPTTITLDTNEAL
jgi:hypothetical protein